MSNFPHYTTIVLTGGFGTRLSSVVPDQPKILAPIGNTPFLTYFLEWFSNSSGDLASIIVDRPMFCLTYSNPTRIEALI